MRIRRRSPQGVTLLELMVVVAIAVLLITLAAPSMRELIVKQRLKGINAELVTDLQYARSEAVARNRSISVRFGGSPAMSCYVIYIVGVVSDCDCTRPPGSVCSGVNVEEIRTTQVPASTDVRIAPAPGNPLSISFSRDGMRPVTTSYVIGTSRISSGSGQLTTTVNAMGRPNVCSPDQSLTGVASC